MRAGEDEKTGTAVRLTGLLSARWVLIAGIAPWQRGRGSKNQKCCFGIVGKRSLLCASLPKQARCRNQKEEGCGLLGHQAADLAGFEEKDLACYLQQSSWL